MENNRRDFLKLAGLGLLGATVPQISHASTTDRLYLNSKKKHHQSFNMSG